MKYFLSIFLVLSGLTRLSAQEKHFVFIQADDKQPFYVSLNGKLYSSTASGYVIIPKLTAGDYTMSVGFAQNAIPEQTFECTIANKDLGYTLKNFNEKGWGLFNQQTLDVTMASAAGSNTIAKALSETAPKDDNAVISFEKKKTAPAAEPAKVEEPVAEEPVAKVAEPVVEVADSVAKVAEPVAEVTKPAVEVNEPVAKAAEPVKTTGASSSIANSADIAKVSEMKSEDGVFLSYTDGKGTKADTVHIIIPSSPVAASVATAAPGTTTAAPASETAVSSAPVAKEEQPAPAASSSKETVATANQPRFLDINMSSSNKETAETATKAPGNLNIAENSNCKNVATEEDYGKLRKKMAMETSDEKMISEARKYYRNMCFTTSQIKNLSTLFMTDEGRYKFFDASFVSVADARQYYTLQSELIDPAFVNRFKEMLR